MYLPVRLALLRYELKNKIISHRIQVFLSETNFVQRLINNRFLVFSILKFDGMT